MTWKASAICKESTIGRIYRVILDRQLLVNVLQFFLTDMVSI